MNTSRPTPATAPFLAMLPLLVLSLVPVSASASLLGDQIFGCASATATCDASTNLFGSTGATSATVDPMGVATVEFQDQGAELPGFLTLSADFSNDGDDLITLIFDFGFPATSGSSINWVFTNLDWVSDPTGVVSGIALDSGTPNLVSSLGFTDHSVSIQTAVFDQGPETLVFRLTAAPGTGGGGGDDDDDDDDAEDVPAPAPLLLLLAAMPLIVARRRRC